MTQNEKQKSTKPVQVLNLPQTPGPEPLFNKIVRVRDARSARRLMGKIILEYQKRSITGEDAKTLCYLVSTYLQACTVSDIEERVKNLENK